MRQLITSLLLSVFLFSSFTYAQPPIHELRKKVHLGDVKFDVTTKNKDAREHFLLGAAFLHAFMYQLAIDQFKAAQKLDPGFAMAYWGEAMANKHPIWNYEDVAAARLALKRYVLNRDDRQLTDKEQRYMQAALAYFADKSLRERDEGYRDAMQTFYQTYPNDPNVAALYGLSLLGLASDFANEDSSRQPLLQGRKLIDRLIKQHPHHPGVVHYYLHYHDVGDKSHARQAMSATKTALTIMRSSSHVAHMAAHIYRRLDAWDDFIRANKQSVEAANQLCSMLDGKLNPTCNADNKYHSLEWLHYGYLKTGQFKKAAETLKVMEKVFAEEPSLTFKEWYYRMWSRQVLATKDWKATAINIDPITQKDDQLYWAAYTECAGLLANGLIAAHGQQSIDKQVARLGKVLQDADTLTEPYIGQTCRLAGLELKRTQAVLHGDKAKAKEYSAEMQTIAKARKSTEVTPSLSYLHGVI